MSTRRNSARALEHRQNPFMALGASINMAGLPRLSKGVITWIATGVGKFVKAAICDEFPEYRLAIFAHSINLKTCSLLNLIGSLS